MIEIGLSALYGFSVKDPDFNIMQQSHGLFAIAKLSCYRTLWLEDRKSDLAVAGLNSHLTFTLTLSQALAYP